jgi:TRAP-type C4-dicarboxylate transport system substrate-binding protein
MVSGGQVENCLWNSSKKDHSTIRKRREMMMSTMKRCLLCAVVLVFFTGSALAGPIVLKFATFEPPKSFAQTMVWNPAWDALNKEGEGIIKVETYAGGTLGRNPTKQLKLVKDGVADMAFLLQGYTPGVFPNDEVLEVPLVAENALEANLAIWRMYKKGLLVGYDDVHPVFLGSAQQYGIHSNFLVKRPSDLKGVKLRAVGKMQHHIAAACGYTPVGMPVPKIAESISRGLIKGTLNEWNGVRTFKIGDVAKYHMMVPLGTISFGIMMNKAKYESLPPKAKAIFDKHTGLVLAKKWGAAMDKSLDAYHKKMMADPGRHVYTPKGNELKEWHDVLGKATQAWLKDSPNHPKLLAAFKEELKQIRAGK